jgi:transposase
VEHFSLAQRWLVVKSKTAIERSEKMVDKQIAKQYQVAQRAIEKLIKQEFGCKEDAQKTFKESVKGLEYHQGELVDTEVIEHYVKSGRPKKGSQPTKIGYRLKARMIRVASARQANIEAGSCYVIGTNAKIEELKGEEVIEAYKNQNASIERGFRFLKSPEFFVSSFYVKNVGRLMGLLVVMTLGLLVYSIMERAIGKKLEEQKESLPDQLKKETRSPTMRWIFQMMEGIDVLYIQINQQVDRQIMGITQLRSKIISLFPACVRAIYLTG